jgi:TonB family protein
MFKALYRFIAFSVLIHLFIMGSIYLSKNMTTPKTKEKVEISYINAPKEKKNLQIIEQDKKAINDEEPEKKAFLGRHNQRVKKQTRAVKNGKFTNSNNGNPLANNQSQKNNQNIKSKKNKPKLKDLMPKFDLAKLVKNNNKVQNKQTPAAQSGKKGHQSQTDDHIEDVSIGIETVLNSREFLYYAYYSRIKDKIRLQWGTKIRSKIQKLIQGGRSIASNNDRITKVIIILNKKGTLVGVKVLGRSGIRDLDDAAVEAFKAAAPFPNPPQGMVERDGTVKIHWDFILEANFKGLNNEQNYLARRGK